MTQAELLNSLNTEQREAVVNTDGPILILAGAGSGKTRVMVHRVAYLINFKEVFPSSILCVTFTNNAAGELKERIEKISGEDAAKGMWVGTFHSVCLRILRRDAKLLGYTNNFVIFDEDDKKKLITKLMDELSMDQKYFPVNAMRSKISSLKNSLTSPAEYKKGLSGDAFEEKFARLYDKYEKEMKRNDAMDFDDLLINTLTLFAEHTEVFEYYAKKFRYIMVDEYQDTNEIQFKLVELLSSRNKNICVVGDDDQAIYGWRGADVTNILDFEKHFKGTRVIKLERNYRSTKNIISAANSVIAHNIHRKGKNLYTEIDKGEKVKLLCASDETAEAKFVCSEIKSLEKQGVSLSDMAVMYRTNSQSRILEDEFVRSSIKYNMIGNVRFYERKEIKDILSYMRFAINPVNELSLERIINVPPRGIGDKTLEKIKDKAAEEEIPIFSVIADIEGYDMLTRGAQASIKDFTDLITKFSVLAQMCKPSQFIEAIVGESGYLEWINKSNDESKEDRLANIKEFINAAAQYESAPGDEEKTVEGFLENMALVSDADGLPRGGVKLMTVHAAKGCEFDTVFLTGLEQGLFPLPPKDDLDGEEEERRLFYVGVTRARRRLYITRARTRWNYKSRDYKEESQFLREMDRECYTYLKEHPQAKPFPSYSQGDGSYRSFMNQGAAHTPISQSSGYAKAKNAADDFMSFFAEQAPKKAPEKKAGGKSYATGDKVKHARYGVGTVISVKESGGNTMLSIAFDSQGIKVFSAELAVLEKL